MKAAIIVVLFIHGLIHVLSFAKAFGLAKAEQLTQFISKLVGIFWLLEFP
jgi:hypothetical protein